MEFLSGTYLVLTLVAVLVLVLWVCLPFAVFGVKPVLRRQVELLEQQNELLNALVQRLTPPTGAPRDYRP